MPMKIQIYKSLVQVNQEKNASLPTAIGLSHLCQEHGSSNGIPAVSLDRSLTVGQLSNARLMYRTRSPLKILEFLLDYS